jgi:hypothetical protein
VTLLDRVRECNAHDLSRFLPWRIDGRPAGWVRPGLAEALAGFDDVFAVDRSGVRLAAGLDGFEARTEALGAVVEALGARRLVRRLGHELYPVAPAFGAAPWLVLQRAAMPSFGARAWGVHLHGLVRREDGLHLWIARRARDKPTFPGLLDNLVAGGQPHGLSVRDNLLKECAEEASIPPELAARAVPTGTVTYKCETGWGLRNDGLFLFELELPEDFVPVNADGEVESFELWPLARVVDTVAHTRDFKFNCNLAIIDLLIRLGYLGPGDPDYAEIVAGLHG